MIKAEGQSQRKKRKQGCCGISITVEVLVSVAVEVAVQRPEAGATLDI